MRRAARYVGVLWMAACFGLWLWVGLSDWGIRPFGHLPPLVENWTALGMIQDTKYGLTFVPILLGLLGYLVYDWGKKPHDAAK